MMGVKSIFKPVAVVLDKNAPTIFAVCGGISLTGAAVLSFRAGTKAGDILKDLPKTEDKKEEIKIKAKALAPLIAPPSTAWLIGMGFLYLSNREYLKRLAVMSLAYAAAEKKGVDVMDKVKETFGDKKAEKIQSDISQDKVLAEAPDTTQVILTGHGEYLCKDGWSGRYFKSSIESVKTAVNELNASLLRDGYVSINDFYAYLGLQTVQYGDEIGWNRTYDDLVDISYDSCLTTDGIPCIVLRYSAAPRYDFDSDC